ncbi:transposase (fragment) [Methylocella tundrae]|uniref:Transposase n=1 Tax=Methylocella tundrae TaxID=227605 RepID=A0A8B6M080_METTU
MTPAAERNAVAHLMSVHGMSERRAKRIKGSAREARWNDPRRDVKPSALAQTMRYKTTRADDAALRERMTAIAHERRRFGYRRVHVLLRRENYVVNHKKLFGLSCCRQSHPS